MTRDILHINIPHFPISLARVVDSSLRERPVAMAPGHSDRTIIQCASPEALAEGVSEGMPVFRARQFCPSLTFLPPDPRLVSRGIKSLLALTSNYTPIFEPAFPGRIFLDLSGSSRLLGPGRDTAVRLDREITERLRLRGTVGVAGNKLVSQIASTCLNHHGVCDIIRGSEGSFLAPLRVSVLPGVGKTREKILLTDLNLRRVGDVAAISVPNLALIFGPFAHLLHQRSMGVDPSPVLPPKHLSEIAEESFLTVEDNCDLILRSELYRLAEGCGIRIRRSGKAAGELTLTIHYSDGVAASRSSLLSFPTDMDIILFAAADKLFDKTCQRRVRVRGMRLMLGRITSVDNQLGLFTSGGTDGISRKTAALQVTLDRIREKYGMESLRWGSTLSPGA